jgi:hypothetical protein
MNGKILNISDAEEITVGGIIKTVKLIQKTKSRHGTYLVELQWREQQLWKIKINKLFTNE